MKQPFKTDKTKIASQFKTLEKRSKTHRTELEDQTINLRYEKQKFGPGFVIVPPLMINDFRLDVNAREVYLQLKSVAGWKDITNLAILTIAGRIGRHPDTVQKGLNLLRDCGYIYIVRAQSRSSVYILLADQENPKQRLEYLLSFTPVQLWNACSYKSKYYQHKKV